MYFRTFTLHVLEIPHKSSKTDSVVISTLKDILLDQTWCLDIDMDFYSTQNPFKGVLGDHFDCIHDIFRFRDQSSIEETLKHRKSQLACLKNLCNEDIAAASNSADVSLYLSNLISRHPNLCRTINEAREIVRGDEFITDLFYIGQQTELPHHVSTADEIQTLLKKTEFMLKSLDSHPVAITMARSEYDEYSSPGTLDHVHTELVEMLKALYNVPASLKPPDK